MAQLFQIPLTGCGVNPARSLATNIVVEGSIKSDFYVSWRFKHDADYLRYWFFDKSAFYIIDMRISTWAYFQGYIVGPLLASVIGGLLYDFVFNPHYGAKKAYENVENNNAEEMT